MTNLLLVLAILFATLFVIIPLIEKTAKPVSEENLQKYHKIFGVLMLLMAIGLIIRYFIG